MRYLRQLAILTIVFLFSCSNQSEEIDIESIDENTGSSISDTAHTKKVSKIGCGLKDMTDWEWYQRQLPPCKLKLRPDVTFFINLVRLEMAPRFEVAQTDSWDVIARVLVSCSGAFCSVEWH